MENKFTKKEKQRIIELCGIIYERELTQATSALAAEFENRHRHLDITFN